MLFYQACVVARQQRILDNAVSARVSQADKKGWQDFVKKTQETVTKTAEKTKAKPVRKDSTAMASFFQRLATAKGREQ